MVPESVWLLAERLFDAMEGLDPSDGSTWGELSRRRRDFYRLSVEGLLEDENLLTRALGDYNAVDRAWEEGKQP